MPQGSAVQSRLHVVFTGTLLLSGCANLTTYNRQRVNAPGVATTTFIDAKQRAVFAIPQPVVVNGASAWATRICAEPSPDALSALAAAGNGGLSVQDKASLQAAFSIAETASNIGLRTQSIQLMRDAMFRICEGVASGTLTGTQSETLFRRFQNSMVAILAIEQLTGVVKGSTAQLSTASSSGAAKEVAALAENTAKAHDTSAAADADAKQKAQALADATAKRDAYLKTNGVTADTLTDAQKPAFAPLQQAVTDATTANAAAITATAEAKEKLAIYQAGMQAVHGGDLSTSGTATTVGGTGGQLDASTATAIAQAVQNIVTAQFDMGFFRDACATLFDAEIDGRLNPQADALKVKCDSFAQTTIDNSVKQMDAYVRTMAAQADAYEQSSKDYGAYLLKWGGGAASNGKGQDGTPVPKSPTRPGALLLPPRPEAPDAFPPGMTKIPLQANQPPDATPIG